MLIFSLFSYTPSALIEENSMGTVPFALRFLKLALFVNVVYTLVSLALAFTILPQAAGMPLMGLWPIIFTDMVIQCY